MSSHPPLVLGILQAKAFPPASPPPQWVQGFIRLLCTFPTHTQLTHTMYTAHVYTHSSHTLCILHMCTQTAHTDHAYCTCTQLTHHAHFSVHTHTMHTTVYTHTVHIYHAHCMCTYTHSSHIPCILHMYTQLTHHAHCSVHTPSLHTHCMCTCTYSQTCMHLSIHAPGKKSKLMHTMFTHRYTC